MGIGALAVATTYVEVVMGRSAMCIQPHVHISIDAGVDLLREAHHEPRGSGGNSARLAEDSLLAIAEHHHRIRIKWDLSKANAA